MGRQLLVTILVSKFGPLESFQPVAVEALIDTGATRSGVCPSVVDQLELPQIGTVPLESATDDRLVPLFFCWMAIDPSITEPSRELGAPSPHFFGAMEALGLRQSRSFEAILGMDVLSQCDLHLERSGFCTLRFG